MKTLSKTMTKRTEAMNAIRCNEGVQEEEYKGLTIFTYQNRNDKPTAAIFNSKGYKPLDWYHFRSLQERTDFIDQAKKRMDIAEASLIKDRIKWEAEKAKVVVGSIFVSTWGYEQTNVDFYQVVARKNDFVTLRAIRTIKSYDNGYNDRGSCLPNISAFCGPEFRKKIDKWGGISFESYKGGILWDGREVYWSSYA